MTAVACRTGPAADGFMYQLPVAMQRGDKGLLNSATFSLNVGGAK